MVKIKSLLDYFGWPVLGLSFLLLVVGCKNEDKTAEEIVKIPIELSISRFDREFANANPKDLPELKSKYPYLFPAQFSDSIWEAKLTDTIQKELSEEVHKAFGDFKTETEDLESLFRHVKY
ncbi:MAG: gliding motility lipoprotein GldB, partial [Allomuricauda sp.]